MAGEDVPVEETVAGGDLPEEEVVENVVIIGE